MNFRTLRILVCSYAAAVLSWLSGWWWSASKRERLATDYWTTKDTDHTLSVSRQVEVLKVRRPFLQFDNLTVVFVTEDEQKLLMSVYKNRIRNKDGSVPLVFLADRTEPTKPHVREATSQRTNPEED